MTPEEQSRKEIDSLLQQSGWLVQDQSAINLSASRGVAILRDGGPSHGEYVEQLETQNIKAEGQPMSHPSALCWIEKE